jgi:hypothetical protein
MHGPELVSQLTPDGVNELQLGLQKDGEFFRFSRQDLNVFVKWYARYTGIIPTPIPLGEARQKWKEIKGTQREPEDFYQ